MGTGQGGPYQINNYAADMVSGTYAPAGHSLINFVALQPNIGYTLANAATQYQRATPASFNDKYYGPMLAAYFHFNDYIALNQIGKGTGGWTTPWEPQYDNAIANFTSCRATSSRSCSTPPTTRATTAAGAESTARWAPPRRPRP